jgi:hypothetical protein
MVIGINEGAKIFYKVINSFDSFVLANQTLNITGTQIDVSNFKVHLTNSYTIYKFLTPYFAFNQKNFKRFKNAGTMKERKELIDSILAGNILSFLKSINVWLKKKLFVDFFYTRSRRIHFKEILVNGLMGEFAANIKLPDFIGLGKSTSLGHGVILNRQREGYGNN